MRVLLFLLVFFAGSSWALVHSNYSEAVHEAVEQKKLLFIVFDEQGQSSLAEDFLKEHENDRRHVFLKIDDSATFSVDGKSQNLRQHAAFQPLSTKSGVVILDYMNQQHYRHVVTVMPRPRCTKQNLEVVLNLPYGSLEQRTMVWAVRTHPARPQSTQGEPGVELMAHAQKHARKMAHHSANGHAPYLSGSMWNTPAQQHASNHPGSTEIIVTTWPYGTTEITAAAEEMVGSWHNAYSGVPTGHWGVVMKRWSQYGYGMAFDGKSRTWYGCGVAQ